MRFDGNLHVPQYCRHIEMEKAVAGVMGATSKTVETVLSHIPGTAEHAVAAGAKQAQREEERQRRHEEQHEKNVHFNEGSTSTLLN